MAGAELRDAELAEFLDDNTFFQTLKEPTRRVLAAAATARRYPDGYRIFEQGDASADFYLVLSGSVELRRGQSDGGKDHAVAIVDEGQVFGEMAFLDSAPRSASAVAAEDSAIAWFDRARVESEAGNADAVIADLAPKFASHIAGNLRRTNENYTESLSRELEVMQERQEFGRLFVATTIALGCALIVGQLASEMIIDVSSWEFDWFYLAVLFLPVAALVLASKRQLSDFGINARLAGRSLIESVLIGVAVIIVVLGVTAAVSPATRNLVVTDPIHLRPGGIMLLYLLHSFLQEFVCRGVLQTSLRRFFADERGYGSVVLAALFFGILHVHFGILMVAITFAAGLLFGFVFLRHGTLIGVTVLHFMIGEGRYAFGHWFG